MDFFSQSKLVIIMGKSVRGSWSLFIGMKTISVVIPLYNEEDALPEFIRRLVRVLHGISLPSEMVFVDDGSSDRTYELLGAILKTHQSMRVVRFSRNFGHQAAVTAGIDHASGDALVIIDGDLQDPPELIPEFIKKYNEGYDVVYGIRMKRKERWIMRFCYFLFYRILHLTSSGVTLPLDSGDFSLISRRVAEVLRSMPERNRYVRGLRAWAGFLQTGVMYERDARYAGKTKYGFFRLLRLAYDGIFSFSYFPLRLITALGVFTSVSSFAVIAVLVYLRFFVNQYIPGWTSLAIAVLFLGGVQLISLGIIGEYLRRVYEEAKQRPLYIVKEKIGFNS